MVYTILFWILVVSVTNVLGVLIVLVTGFVVEYWLTPKKDRKRLRTKSYRKRGRNNFLFFAGLPVVGFYWVLRAFIATMRIRRAIWRTDKGKNNGKDS